MIPNDEKMDWTAEAIATLRTLWDEGHTTAEIGRRMNVSKNTIVGKAHRLQLPPRPSPIRGAPRDRGAPTPIATITGVAPIVPAPSKPPVPTIAPPSKTAPVTSREAVVVAPPPPMPAPVPQNRPLVTRPGPHPVPQPSSGRHGACQWPIGEPGKPDFRFCGAEPVAGKPYCPDHCGHAYVRFRADAPAATAS